MTMATLLGGDMKGMILDTVFKATIIILFYLIFAVVFRQMGFN